MACGDRYEYLLVTSTGKKPADYSEVPGYALLADEYGQAKSVAETVANQVKQRWSEVQRLQRSAANLAKGGADLGPILDALPTRLGAYEESYGALPLSTWTAPFTSDVELVNLAFANAREGTCLMETLDQAVELMGGKPIEAPGATDPEERRTFWDDLASATVGLGLLGLTAGGIYLAVKSRKGREG